jgi:hypothetical protein
MANMNQTRARKAIKDWQRKWEAGFVGKKEDFKNPKAKGAAQPGFKVKTNPWTRNA